MMTSIGPQLYRDSALLQQQKRVNTISNADSRGATSSDDANDANDGSMLA